MMHPLVAVSVATRRQVAVDDVVARSLIFFVIIVITAAISINYECHMVGCRLVGAERIDITPYCLSFGYMRQRQTLPSRGNL